MRQFLSTLSLRRATVTVLGIQHRVGISIHALLAESDESRQPSERPTKDFYPRSPCGERLDDLEPSSTRKLTFLSTLSLRRATRRRTCHRYENQEFLSTLSLRRATINSRTDNIKRDISIHALLAESDHGLYSLVAITPSFLSTLSLRRATFQFSLLHFRFFISIHALLAESDVLQS